MPTFKTDRWSSRIRMAGALRAELCFSHRWLLLRRQPYLLVQQSQQ